VKHTKPGEIYNLSKNHRVNYNPLTIRFFYSFLLCACTLVEITL